VLGGTKRNLFDQRRIIDIAGAVQWLEFFMSRCVP
jgi:hypothetical protein